MLPETIEDQLTEAVSEPEINLCGSFECFAHTCQDAHSSNVRWMHCFPEALEVLMYARLFASFPTGTATLGIIDNVVDRTVTGLRNKLLFFFLSSFIIIG